MVLSTRGDAYALPPSLPLLGFQPESCVKQHVRVSDKKDTSPCKGKSVNWKGVSCRLKKRSYRCIPNFEKSVLTKKSTHKEITFIDCDSGAVCSRVVGTTDSCYSGR